MTTDIAPIEVVPRDTQRKLTWKPTTRDVIANTHNRIAEICNPDGNDIRTARN